MDFYSGNGVVRGRMGADGICLAVMGVGLLQLKHVGRRLLRHTDSTHVARHMSHITLACGCVAQVPQRCRDTIHMPVTHARTHTHTHTRTHTHIRTSAKDSGWQNGQGHAYTTENLSKLH